MHRCAGNLYGFPMHNSKKKHQLLYDHASRSRSRRFQMSGQKQEKTQREKFEEAARQLKTDDSEEHFDQIVKKIAKAPLPKDEKPRDEER